jgi:hypothetical protein
VPKKPIRRSMPQRPVRMQKTTYMVASTMAVDLVGQQPSRFRR